MYIEKFQLGVLFQSIFYKQLPVLTEVEKIIIESIFIFYSIDNLTGVDFKLKPVVKYIH